MYFQQMLKLIISLLILKLFKTCNPNKYILILIGFILFCFIKPTVRIQYILKF